MINPEFTRGFLAGLEAAKQVVHETRENLLRIFDSEIEGRAALLTSAMFAVAFEEAKEMIKARSAGGSNAASH